MVGRNTAVIGRDSTHAAMLSFCTAIAVTTGAAIRQQQCAVSTVTFRRESGTTESVPMYDP